MLNIIIAHGYYNYTIVLRKRPTMECLPIPQFSLDFILRSKTYLKEYPPIANITNKEFPLSRKLEDVVSQVYTHYKVQTTLLHSGLH